MVLAIGFGCTRQVISERIGTELKRKEVFLILSRLERVVDVQEMGKEFLGRTSSITGLSILERAALGAPHVCGIKLQREGAMRPHSHVTKGVGGAFPKTRCSPSLRGRCDEAPHRHPSSKGRRDQPLTQHHLLPSHALALLALRPTDNMFWYGQLDVEVDGVGAVPRVYDGRLAAHRGVRNSGRRQQCKYTPSC